MVNQLLFCSKISAHVCNNNSMISRCHAHSAQFSSGNFTQSITFCTTLKSSESVCMSCPVCHPLILSRVCVTTCVTFLFVLRWYLQKLSIVGVTVPCTPILDDAPSQCQLAFVLCQTFIFYLHDAPSQCQLAFVLCQTFIFYLHDSAAMWVVIKAFRVLFYVLHSLRNFLLPSLHIFLVKFIIVNQSVNYLLY